MDGPLYTNVICGTSKTAPDISERFRFKINRGLDNKNVAMVF
jgi:hypothetical protein